MSNPNPPSGRAFARWPLLAGIAALLLYAVFLHRHAAVVAGGADSSGYLNSARLLGEGRLQETLRAPPELGPVARLDRMHFLPQGFFPARDADRLNPTYPTGLPLHLAAAQAVLGTGAGTSAVMLGAAVGALALMYLAARWLGLGPPLAGAGVVALAACPVFLFTSIQPLSDTLATTWGLAALVAGLRAGGSSAWAAAAGGALAVATLVRPTNLLLAPALLLLIGFSPRRWAAFVAGGLPGAAWLAWYNHALYGHPLASGYGNIGAAFALEYGPRTALHFAKWLALLLPAALLALPLAAAARKETRGRRLLALLLVFAAIAGCYAFYEVSHEVWWCLRFILPAMPALILAGLIGVEALARGPGARWPRVFRPAAAAVLVLWAAAIAVHWSPRLAVFEMRRYEQAYADGAGAALARFRPGALVVCSAFSGALYYYTPFAVLRSDQLQPADFTRHAERLQTADREIGAVLFESEATEAFRRCPGNWTRVARVGNVGLWRLAPP
ncbi:MAG: hypothetical protein RIR76_1099 [Verrucomicrobiota bacterium]|jgi:hypothetical protein|nr:hypothetical protein [Opitutaceae bacterium]